MRFQNLAPALECLPPSFGGPGARSAAAVDYPRQAPSGLHGRESPPIGGGYIFPFHRDTACWCHWPVVGWELPRAGLKDYGLTAEGHP